MAAVTLAIGAGLIASALAQAAPAPAVTNLPNTAEDDLRGAFSAFRVSCVGLLGDVKPMRSAQPPPEALWRVCRIATTLPATADAHTARRFFATQFAPRRVGAPNSAFFTGYYEPIVDGSLTKSKAFPTPLYAKPADLVPVPADQVVPGLALGLTMARRLPDGTLVAMPDRAAIETGAPGLTPLVYVHDAVEAFFIQIQGSARIALPDGTLKRLVYAGRNGYPYTSIGKVLAQTLHIAPADMGLAQLKAWIRANGEGPGESGARLMQTNRSYIFFQFDDTLPASSGPIGASGVSVTALRSLAVDRSVWAYGLPMVVEADIAWRGATATPFRRLMIAQDTGSAIIGPARADIFFGTGPEAAKHAGTTRANGTLTVLWPKADAP